MNSILGTTGKWQAPGRFAVAAVSVIWLVCQSFGVFHAVAHHADLAYPGSAESCCSESSVVVAHVDDHCHSGHAADETHGRATDPCGDDSHPDPSAPCPHGDDCLALALAESSFVESSNDTLTLPAERSDVSPPRVEPAQNTTLPPLSRAPKTSPPTA